MGGEEFSQLYMEKLQKVRFICVDKGLSNIFKTYVYII